MRLLRRKKKQPIRNEMREIICPNCGSSNNHWNGETRWGEISHCCDNCNRPFRTTYDYGVPLRAYKKYDGVSIAFLEEIEE